PARYPGAGHLGSQEEAQRDHDSADDHGGQDGVEVERETEDRGRGVGTDLDGALGEVPAGHCRSSRNTGTAAPSSTITWKTAIPASRPMPSGRTKKTATSEAAVSRNSRPSMPPTKPPLLRRS